MVVVVVVVLHCITSQHSRQVEGGWRGIIRSPEDSLHPVQSDVCKCVGPPLLPGGTLTAISWGLNAIIRQKTITNATSIINVSSIITNKRGIDGDAASARGKDD